MASSTKGNKGNVIPGAAIATAVMPPRCTAGFGLASGNFYYFFGAFYLYFINSVFISLATFLVVRLVKYPKKVFVDKGENEKTAKWLSNNLKTGDVILLKGSNRMNLEKILELLGLE